MSRLTDSIRKKMGGSPLETGRKYDTDELVGKVTHFSAADLVTFTDPNTGEVVSYSVWKLSDGYYCGGKSLTAIWTDVISEDDDLLDEFNKDGLTVILTGSTTKKGNNFTKVSIVENDGNYDIS